MPIRRFCIITQQELSELLSISTEDTLAGSLQVPAFLREPVKIKILGGAGNAADDDDSHKLCEDAQFVAVLALNGGSPHGDSNIFVCSRRMLGSRRSLGFGQT